MNIDAAVQQWSNETIAQVKSLTTAQADVIAQTWARVGTSNSCIDGMRKLQVFAAEVHAGTHRSVDEAVDTAFQGNLRERKKSSALWWLLATRHADSLSLAEYAALTAPWLSGVLYSIIEPSRVQTE